MKVLIIIPAYNEEENIRSVASNLIENYAQFDYVIINDGSKDATERICNEHDYNIINLPVNLGLSGAVQTGLRYAYINGYDAAVQYDADGQHNAEYIELMKQELEKGYEIVIGSRFVTEKKPNSLRMLGSNIISFAILLTTGVKITDPTSGMRMFDKATIKEFAFDSNYELEPDTISYLIKNGAKIKEVQVEMNERILGESYLNFTRSIVYMLKVGLSILTVQWLRKRKVEEV